LGVISSVVEVNRFLSIGLLFAFGLGVISIYCYYLYTS
jgi:hypothetical protein